MKENIHTLEKILVGKTEEEAIKALSEALPGKVVFSTSLGYEDQVITHFIFSQKLPVTIFTLDTGRLFNETYSVLESTIKRYGQNIQVYFPKHEALEKLLTAKGPYSFYESVENRKECCYIRKVEPLKRALAGYTVWITGIRAEQSDGRKEMPQLEWDEANQIIKYHPLLHWSLDQVKEKIAKDNIPYNPLHDKGFVSIGCQPCTRAIKDGEDFRAGRWWWEQNDKKECGLHAN